jgi:DNA gyrase subunit B
MHAPYVHWTGSQDDHAPHIHLNIIAGLGLAPLNFVSDKLIVQSWRCGVLWEQRFIKGIAQSPATVIQRGNGRGTKIEITPDPEIFKEAKPRVGVIRRALFEAAHLISGLKIEFHEERFFAPDGLQMLGFILLDPYANPDTSPFHITLRQQDILIEVAIFGKARSRTRTYSWVNGTRTPDHGSHADGLQQALKKVGWKPKLSLIHVVMFDPKFAGPMRSKLAVPHIQNVIEHALGEPLQQHQNIRDS